MTLSKEWTDWHLTPRGWERGSQRTDGVGVEEKEPVADRILTHRWSEVQTSGYSQMVRHGERMWESGDKVRLAELLEEHGEPPESL